MKAIEMVKDAGEKIVVGRSRYRKTDVVSIRVWYLNITEGKWVPT